MNPVRDYGRYREIYFIKSLVKQTYRWEKVYNRDLSLIGMKTWIEFNWLKLLAIAFALGAVQTAVALPFAYYQYMNWIVLGASLMLARQANSKNKMFFVWLFILVAVTFNPLAPMYFRADIWQVLDLVVAGLFLASFFLVMPDRD